MFITYQKTGYQGYLQPFYSLEQASQELNHIIGHHAYQPEKLLYLAMTYYFNLYFILPEDWELYQFRHHIKYNKNQLTEEHIDQILYQFSYTEESLTHMPKEYKESLIGESFFKQGLPKDFLNWVAMDSHLFASLEHKYLAQMIKSQQIILNLNQYKTHQLFTIYDCYQQNTPYIYDVLYHYFQELNSHKNIELFIQKIAFSAFQFKSQLKNILTIKFSDLMITAYDLQCILNGQLNEEQRVLYQQKNLDKIKEKNKIQLDMDR